jgi:hypothetical protein
VLPNFLVIGAHKAGTTTLYEHLRRHPDVFLAAHKEVHYFSGHNWDRGRQWYESLFDDVAGEHAVGEASPGYACWPFFEHVPERAAALIPAAKLVYIVRHPIERLISHYRHDATYWGESQPIDEAVLDHRAYVSRSMYALQIDQWRDAGYAADQILVITTEDLRDRATETLAGVFRFLGVDDSFQPKTVGEVFNYWAVLRRPRGRAEAVRRSGLHRRVRALVPARARQWAWRRMTVPVDPALVNITIRPETEAALRERLQPDLRRLREYLGADFDCWGLLDDAPANSAEGPAQEVELQQQ